MAGRRTGLAISGTLMSLRCGSAIFLHSRTEFHPFFFRLFSSPSSYSPSDCHTISTIVHPSLISEHFTVFGTSQPFDNNSSKIFQDLLLYFSTLSPNSIYQPYSSINSTSLLASHNTSKISSSKDFLSVSALCLVNHTHDLPSKVPTSKKTIRRYGR
jgi:hypothetical protein